MITAEILRELLHYDPETGIFTWRSRRGRIMGGSMAGSIDHMGYRHIRIGKLYRAARLAVLYMTGRWPVNEVDHINCVPSDNRWLNLREATRAQNITNRKYSNSTGFRGVYIHKKSGLYRASLQGKSLGYYKTPSEAHQAFVTAAKERHGEFFRAA